MIRPYYLFFFLVAPRAGPTDQASRIELAERDKILWVIIICMHDI